VYSRPRSTTHTTPSCIAVRMTSPGAMMKKVRAVSTRDPRRRRLLLLGVTAVHSRPSGVRRGERFDALPAGATRSARAGVVAMLRGAGVLFVRGFRTNGTSSELSVSAPLLSSSASCVHARVCVPVRAPLALLHPIGLAMWGRLKNCPADACAGCTSGSTSSAAWENLARTGRRDRR
jgi:hypothetical protein